MRNIGNFTEDRVCFVWEKLLVAEKFIHRNDKIQYDSSVPAFGGGLGGYMLLKPVSECYKIWISSSSVRVLKGRPGM